MKNQNVIWYKGKRYVSYVSKPGNCNCNHHCDLQYECINDDDINPPCLPHERTDNKGVFFKRETILKSLIKKLGI